MYMRIIRNSTYLKAIYRAEPFQRRLMIEFADMDQLNAICDIATDIIQGQLFLANSHRPKLKQYRNVIRALASRNINTARKQRTLLAYHDLIPLLIFPIIPFLD